MEKRVQKVTSPNLLHDKFNDGQRTDMILTRRINLAVKHDRLELVINCKHTSSNKLGLLSRVRENGVHTSTSDTTQNVRSSTLE
jgi:hypothetical protein